MMTIDHTEAVLQDAISRLRKGILVKILVLENSETNNDLLKIDNYNIVTFKDKVIGDIRSYKEFRDLVCHNILEFYPMAENKHIPKCRVSYQ